MNLIYGNTINCISLTYNVYHKVFREQVIMAMPQQIKKDTKKNCAVDCNRIHKFVIYRGEDCQNITSIELIISDTDIVLHAYRY